MTGLQGAFIGIYVAVGLLFLWRLVGGNAAKSSLNAVTFESLDAKTWSVRSVGIKAAIGALVAVGVTLLGTVLTRRNDGKPPSSAFVLGSVVFAAVAGAAIGFCLALKDLVEERQVKGQRVPLILRAYYGWGTVSMILWIVTLFAAGIFGIVFYYSFLSPGVGPATSYAD